MTFALLSPYDKSGLVEFARVIKDAGYDLLSTGGTHAVLAGAGLPVRQVADVTGSPEILDGRVKTLHPVIHGGLLARRSDPDHMAQLEDQGIEPIDIVVGNLYPFRETVARPGASFEDALENIDIGGPTMIRAAAKNHPDVVVVVDPDDYERVGAMLASGGVSGEERRRLAAKAFQHVALYDTAVASYLRDAADDSDPSQLFPDEFTAGFKLRGVLRYGENPHQPGALYSRDGGTGGGIAGAELLHGRAMSYINYLDADAAWTSVAMLPSTAVSVVKHANTCGLAMHADQTEAYRRAFAGDPVSAYGGIVGFNSTVTVETAEAMRPVFYEVVAAPGYEPEALEILKKKSRNLRLLRVVPESEIGLALHTVSGGVLIQAPDRGEDDRSLWKVVTERQPTEDERADLEFAWHACRLIKSNAIVLVKARAIVGMGAGQPNRVNSAHLAVRAAADAAAGSVLASDAFFPFPDTLELAAEAGVKAAISPAGSIRDDEVVAAANRLGMAVIMTGNRHFLH
ncbi:MAG: bifunctional phosphoribosylaminoimidazolecarboxamide formyltransferase/IMP cyclohydrolase [Chloroflexi bacterium]|nr:bifunctional phosphoribosylaminoimidazolecarboxamide formyltransferase/IMP cyclohydrolase [Chloroflexota bacterium]